MTKFGTLSAARGVDIYEKDVYLNKCLSFKCIAKGVKKYQERFSLFTIYMCVCFFYFPMQLIKTVLSPSTLSVNITL